MTSARSFGLNPADVRVRCAGAQHTLTWAAGELTATDHPDPDRERALVALGAQPYRCLELLDHWQRHADDLDVLALASRGVTDEVPVVGRDDDEDDDGQVHLHIGAQSYRPMSGVMYSGSYRPMRRTGFGWVPHHGHDHVGRDRGIETLLTLDRGLADRLVATVVGTWVQRIADDDPRVAAARPALHAALYGRALATVRTWLGDPALEIELDLLGLGDEPYAARAERGTIHLGLGVQWLTDVWVPQVAVAFGRLCLTAERTVDAAGGHSWRLLTVGPDLDTQRLMTVSW